MNRIIVSCLLGFAAVAFAQAQPVRIKSAMGTVCYGGTGDRHTLVEEPAAYKKIKNSNGRTQATANIEVTYQNFSPEAQAAFQKAVEIWESLLTSDVTIHVLARWAPLGANILGGASPGTYVANFEGSPRRSIWYPIALAEKLAGKDLNSTSDPDIVATFNSSNTNWHFGINAAPASGKFDLISIVLHEIGHGLGITNAYEVENAQGVLSSNFDGQPVVFETFVESQQGQNLVLDFAQPSTALGTQITSENLFFNSPLVKANNSDQRARIYAPATYDGGSSIAHLDEASYVAGNANSLMTPFINPAERILDPGPISMNILREMGWLNTFIKHTPLKNTENATTPYEVKCTILAENGYNASSVKLFYTTTGNTFTELSMTATGNANEFKASIPTGSTDYAYYLSVTDNDGRTLTKPGVVYQQNNKTTFPHAIEFSIGPDTKAPSITHTAKDFVLNTEPFIVESFVTDDMGISEVMLDYKVNGVSKPAEAMTLKPDTDSTYTRQIAFSPALQSGDIVQYRIRAKDAAAAKNETAIPSTNGFFSVAVEGFEPAVTSYQSNFNATNTDFFGIGFSMATPAGFANGALHSTHPYPEGSSFATGSRELIYNLRIPVIIQADNALLSYDEIVLVEPAETGSVFGEENFFDYVVVEGSKDGGANWIPVADGYNSRDNSVWLAQFNSSISGNNSTATGSPALYMNRVVNLLDKFAAGDEVVFRFRLHSDQFATGWGWAVDNLKIQQDITPPTIKHQHVDFVLASAAKLGLSAKVTDAAGVDEITVEYNVNGGTNTSAALPALTAGMYGLDLSLSSANIKAGDQINYRFKAKDINGNESVFPATGTLTAAVLTLQSSVPNFVTDFSGNPSPIVGNFFSVAKPTGFSNEAVHSDHPYRLGTGPDNNLNFSWLIKQAIKLDATNPFIVFSEIAVTEYAGANVKDYMIVEASKDGTTWEALEPAYGSLRFANWKSAFDNNGTPNNSLFQEHRLDLRAGGKFKGDDVVLLRFRMLSDAATAGWGWAVDNLSIQGPITGVGENGATRQLVVYPNPAREVVRITADLENPAASLQFHSALGTIVHSEEVQASKGRLEKEVFVGNWPAGLYLLVVKSGLEVKTQKLLIAK